MKHKTPILTLIIFLISLCISFAETIQIDTSNLTQEQKDKIAEITKKDTSVNIQGVGKELGVAFKEVWSVVSTDVEKFANSPAGLWAATLVTWKVMGKDASDIVMRAIRIPIAAAVFIVGVLAWLFMLKKLFSPGIYKTYSVDKESGKKELKEVKQTESIVENYWGEVTSLMGIYFLVLTGVCSIIAFI